MEDTNYDILCNLERFAFNNLCQTYLLRFTFALLKQISTSVFDIDKKSANLSVTSSIKPIVYNEHEISN